MKLFVSLAVLIVIKYNEKDDDVVRREVEVAVLKRVKEWGLTVRNFAYDQTGLSFWARSSHKQRHRSYGGLMVEIEAVFRRIRREARARKTAA